MLERQICQVHVDHAGAVSRRNFLTTIAAATTGAALGWQNTLLAAGPKLKKQGKSVIVLWMQGGPSQFETFDPKPEHENGGEIRTIATSVPGIRVAAEWAKVAQMMNDISIVRSMTNKEGNHQRATYQLHTGYVPSGSVRHPSFGSLVTNEIAPAEFDLPGFVSILGPSQGPGFLPVRCGPFRVADPARLPNNSEPLVSDDHYARRLRLLNKLETNYARSGAEQQVADHRGLYAQASRLATSKDLVAFDVSKENASTVARYGGSSFGKGCLLARRLVETGVTYVEVELRGWDTHFDNQSRVASLSQQCDPAFAALIADLKERRMLDNTLVVWMGEFGRTPRINPRGGRDHFPRAFSIACAGGGVKGGRVIGKTSASGNEVADRPVGVTDLFSSFCHSLNIDAKKENQSAFGRPLKIVDGGAVVKELFT